MRWQCKKCGGTAVSLLDNRCLNQACGEPVEPDTIDRLEAAAEREKQCKKKMRGEST